jgi:hypothetical protein
MTVWIERTFPIEGWLHADRLRNYLNTMLDRGVPSRKALVSVLSALREPLQAIGDDSYVS